jgi:hypothetical protein
MIPNIVFRKKIIERIRKLEDFRMGEFSRESVFIKNAVNLELKNLKRIFFYNYDLKKIHKDNKKIKQFMKELSKKQISTAELNKELTFNLAIIKIIEMSYKNIYMQKKLKINKKLNEFAAFYFMKDLFKIWNVEYIDVKQSLMRHCFTFKFNNVKVSFKAYVFGDAFEVSLDDSAFLTDSDQLNSLLIAKNLKKNDLIQIKDKLIKAAKELHFFGRDHSAYLTNSEFEKIKVILGN